MHSAGYWGAGGCSVGFSHLRGGGYVGGDSKIRLFCQANEKLIVPQPPKLWYTELERPTANGREKSLPVNGRGVSWRFNIMAIAHLVSQKVQEVHFVNKISKEGQIQLDSGFSFNVNFAPDGKRCVAKLYQSIKDKEDGEELFLSVDMVGAFACENVETEDDKKLVHAQCYDQLFPYIQSMVQTLMQASGIPGFRLRKAIIDTDQVVVGKGEPQQRGNQPPKIQFPIV